MSPTDPPLLSSANPKTLAQIKGVCFDIDETFSTNGKITDEAFSALWQLKEAGFFLVPVTGRPAGWCDHIARFWPVDAVVGENGAFTFYMEKTGQVSLRKRLQTPGATPENRSKLQKLKSEIERKFPEARFASDQAYREFDLAIDVSEDVTPWSDDRIKALLDHCKASGANAKLSSVHVNTWLGDFDKCKGLAHWFKSGCPGTAGGKAPPKENWIYIGDSPNDEPLFEDFQFSVGVANLKPYLPTLKSPPKWLTKAKSGSGFRELAQALMSVSKTT